MIIQATAIADGDNAVISADSESSARTIGLLGGRDAINRQKQPRNRSHTLLREGVLQINTTTEDHYSGVPLWQTTVASRMLNVYEGGVMLTLRMALVGMAVSTLLMWSSSQSVAAETPPPNSDTNQPRQLEEFKPLTGLDNTPKGGTLPGGTLPSGTLPGGTLPGGTLPGGTLPGGTLPGGTLPGGTVPGGTLPGGTVPGGTLPSGTLAGGPL